MALQMTPPGDRGVASALALTRVQVGGGKGRGQGGRAGGRGGGLDSACVQICKLCPRWTDTAPRPHRVARGGLPLGRKRGPDVPQCVLCSMSPNRDFIRPGSPRNRLPRGLSSVSEVVCLTDPCRPREDSDLSASCHSSCP